jgi:hypothetical protein
MVGCVQRFDAWKDRDRGNGIIFGRIERTGKDGMGESRRGCLKDGEYFSSQGVIHLDGYKQNPSSTLS